MDIGPWELFGILVVAIVVLLAWRYSPTARRTERPVARQPTPAAAAVTISTPPVICAACQTANPSTNRFCSNCGAPLTVPAPEQPAAVGGGETTCPSCATVNPPGQAFCGQCGTRLSPAAA
jgi:predicted amidophosphoribosyltransferase